MSVYEAGSEEDSLQSLAENDPEPGDFLDESADQNFRTKRDFFEKLGNSGKSTETRRQRSRRDISTSAEGSTRCTTSTSSLADIESSSQLRHHVWPSSSEEESKRARSSSQTRQLDGPSSPKENSNGAKSSSQTEQEWRCSSKEKSKAAKRSYSLTRLNSPAKDEHASFRRSYSLTRLNSPAKDEHASFRRSYSLTRLNSPAKDEYASFRRSYSQRRLNSPARGELESFRRSYSQRRLNSPARGELESFRRSGSQEQFGVKCSPVKPIPSRRRPKTMDRPLRSGSQEQFGVKCSPVKPRRRRPKTLDRPLSSSQTKQDWPSSLDEELKGAKRSSQTKQEWRSSSKEESKGGKSERLLFEMNSYKTLRSNNDVNGSEEAGDSLQSLAALSSTNEEKKAERDDSSGKTIQQDFRSKIDYFKNLENSEQATEAKIQESGKKGPIFAKSLNSKSTLRSPLADKEIYTSPRHYEASSYEKDELQSKRRTDSKGEVSPSFSERLESKWNRSIFSPDDMQVFQQPMCLVRTDERKLTIENGTVEQIIKIPWPLIIVAVGGLYRTGKSYLMNIIAGSNKGTNKLDISVGKDFEGFALGNTIQSKTKGIWVWCRIHPEKANTVLMLIDTEGLGDIEKGDPHHDNKLFTLVTLLCNCLVYNMRGAFDQDAVSKLTFITEMSKNIHFRGSTDNENLSLVMPELVLCLRDFSLKFVKDDRHISENEYLEECLEEKKGRDDRFNKPRECIRKYFSVRRCFTFPVPGDGDVIENLETLPFSDLSQKFKEAINRFVSYIFNLAPKKLLASKPVTGQMFATLATRYVRDIDQGAIPDVDDAFQSTAKVENNRITEHALKLFKELLSDANLPAPSRHLEVIYTRAQRETLHYLRENVVHDTEGLYEFSTQKAMEDFWGQLKAENTRKIREMCDIRLQNLSTQLQDKITKHFYIAAGGYRKFQRDLNLLKNTFMSELRDYEEHEILWTWYGFLKTLERTESEIIEVDDNFSRHEKEVERKHYLEQITRINEEHEKSKNKAYEEYRKLIDEHYEKIHEEREEQFRKEQQQYQELSQLKLEKSKAISVVGELMRQQQKKRAKWIFGRIKDAIFKK